ncbi:MAG TPA: protein phosphatase 2C domain-containing protein [Chloroflexia bacterium]|nr:protein phosphatase 2C domain-containing protein [Chloroflexia bacterium]
MNRLRRGLKQVTKGKAEEAPAPEVEAAESAEAVEDLAVEAEAALPGVEAQAPEGAAEAEAVEDIEDAVDAPEAAAEEAAVEPAAPVEVGMPAAGDEEFSEEDFDVEPVQIAELDYETPILDAVVPTAGDTALLDINVAEAEDLARAARAREAEAAQAEEAAVEEAAPAPSVSLEDLPLTGPLLTADDQTGTLTREREHERDDTVPISVVTEREDLTPLAVNAVVDGRYVVQHVLHQSPDRNLYKVAPRRQQRCETCGRLSDEGMNHCSSCGTALEGHPPAEFYLMAESFRPEALMQDPAMMDLNLYHPSLVPVVDFFEHKPFGSMRYYAVAEPRQGVRLSQLSVPRPGMQVLTWAMQLSDAVDYLHSRGVVGAGAEADDILVQGDRASLASLQNARTNVQSQDELTQLRSMDLARLASTMYEAYTGHPAAMSPDGMLPMPSSAPEQVGAAFRAAIEPVQGAAPPISAAKWRDLLAAALEAVTELERPGRPVEYIVAALTDTGRVRDQNQDSFGMSEFAQHSAERPAKLGLYVVADGMGGHQGGEIASAIAVQSFAGEVVGRVLSALVSASSERGAPANEAILQGLVRAAQMANERIFKARDSRQNDMGTTVAAALVAGGKAYMVNVGDSRIYIYSRTRREDTPTDPSLAEPEEPRRGTSPLPGTTPLKGTNILDADRVREHEGDAEEDMGEFVLSQVSVDHSLVHRLVELGQLDPEEAKVHPHRNFIYRSLGGPPPVDVDTFVRTLRPGDRLLICSDGLNSMIEDDAIESVLAAEKDTHEAALKLVELANDAGGHDNITVILIDVTGYLPLPEHPTALHNM